MRKNHPKSYQDYFFLVFCWFLEEFGIPISFQDLLTFKGDFNVEFTKTKKLPYKDFT